MFDLPTPMLLLRHGETAWNLQGRYQGGTDVELLPSGKAQALALAKLAVRLTDAGILDANCLTVVASPLVRANGTAEILANALRLPARTAITTEPRLQELSFGRWEGMTSMEVKDAFYHERKSRKPDPYAFAPMGGDSMALRAPDVVAALRECTPHCLVVTHSGILRIVLHTVGKLDRTLAARAAIPHRGGLLLEPQGLSLCGEGWGRDIRDALNER